MIIKQTHPNTFVIGITGGIGSGKTTVTNAFEALGVPLVDADQIARLVVAPGHPCLTALTQALGTHILNSDQSLNRALLRELIFSDPNIKATVEQIMHPAIRAELLTALAATSSPYVLLSAPLLFENGLDALCDFVLVIDLPEALQISRTLARDQVSETQVKAIMAAQISREKRLAKADQVLDNSLPKSSLSERVANLHQQFLNLAHMQKKSQN